MAAWRALPAALRSADAGRHLARLRAGRAGHHHQDAGDPGDPVADGARFDSDLRAGFDSGALGFTRDGLVVVRDASKLQLKDRVAINQAVADDNRDRKAVYREVAVANGHPEWEAQIRGVFAKQWVDSAHGGWWYQDASGGWKQK